MPPPLTVIIGLACPGQVIAIECNLLQDLRVNVGWVSPHVSPPYGEADHSRAKGIGPFRPDVGAVKAPGGSGNPKDIYLAFGRTLDMAKRRLF